MLDKTRPNGRAYDDHRGVSNRHARLPGRQRRTPGRGFELVSFVSPLTGAWVRFRVVTQGFRPGLICFVPHGTLNPKDFKSEKNEIQPETSATPRNNTMRSCRVLDMTTSLTNFEVEATQGFHLSVIGLAQAVALDRQAHAANSSESVGNRMAADIHGAVLPKQSSTPGRGPASVSQHKITPKFAAGDCIDTESTTALAWQAVESPKVEFSQSSR